MKRAVLIISCVLVLGITTFAQENVQRESLKGLSAVPVEIVVTKGAKVMQLQLQNFVELRLRSAGIRVPEKNAPLQKEGSALLWIIIVSDSEGTLIEVMMKLKQAIRLERRPSVDMWLGTWETRSCGGDDQSTEDVVKKTLNGFLDAFINDYLAVNPK
jgi:hypothetical protein